jgi:hypothetical protein
MLALFAAFARQWRKQPRNYEDNFSSGASQAQLQHCTKHSLCRTHGKPFSATAACQALRCSAAWFVLSLRAFLFTS